MISDLSGVPFMKTDVGTITRATAIQEALKPSKEAAHEALQWIAGRTADDDAKYRTLKRKFITNMPR